MAKESLYTIKFVSGRTGLSPHVIRAWERRYGVTHPKRTKTNRRLYTDSDIEKLNLLRKATLSGQNIGQVAELSLENLQILVAKNEKFQATAFEESISDHSAASHLNVCLKAAQSFDTRALERALNAASVQLSQPVLLQHVVTPLLERIGSLWKKGSFRICQEHLTSAAVRTFLGNLSATNVISPSAPGLVVTTPSGQLHEMGALMAAITAVSEGWRVAYLGPNLPAEEIAAAASRIHIRAVALSIVHPGDDSNLVPELLKLRRLLGKNMQIFIGGRGASIYTNIFRKIDAIYLEDMSGLRQLLESFHSTPRR